MLDQDQISKYISDELQIPQILLWCNEIDVLVRAGFVEQLQSFECWDRAANTWRAARGRFQGPDSATPQSAQMHPFLTIFIIRDSIWTETVRVNKPSGFSWFVCFIEIVVFTWRKIYDPL